MLVDAFGVKGTGRLRLGGQQWGVVRTKYGYNNKGEPFTLQLHPDQSAIALGLALGPWTWRLGGLA